MVVGLSICSLSSQFLKQKIRKKRMVRCTSSPVVAAGRTHLADEFVTCSNHLPGSGAERLFPEPFRTWFPGFQPISIRGPLDASVECNLSILFTCVINLQGWPWWTCSKIPPKLVQGCVIWGRFTNRGKGSLGDMMINRWIWRDFP